MDSINMDDVSIDDEYIEAGIFEDATKTVVRTLGSNFGLDVVFAGNGAKTDGNTVYLPSQDSKRIMTRKQYVVGQGYANHETLHNLCTDMSFFLKETARLGSEGKQLAKMMANAIEDVRIEKAGGIMYPGIPGQINSTADFVAKEFLDKYLEKDPTIIEDFKRVGPLAVTWRGRQRLGYNSPYIQKCIDSLSEENLKKVDAWCDLIDQVPTGAKGLGDIDRELSFKGSRDVIALAEMIAKEIDEADEEEQQQQQPQQGGQGQPQQGSGSSGEPQQKPPTSGDTGAPIDVDMGGAVNSLMTSGRNKEQRSWRPVSRMLDTVITKDSVPIGGGTNPLLDSKNRENYQRILDSISGKTAVMRRKLQRALMAMSNEDYVSGQRRGRLDIKGRGVQIMQNKSNVYRQKIDGKAINTAVSICIDASGSMNGERIDLAHKMAIALTESLQPTGVETEVMTFTARERREYIEDYNTKCAKFREIYQTVKCSKEFHRASAVSFMVLKSFADGANTSKQTMGVRLVASGLTPDGDAILFAARRLRNTKCEKQIMVVLSDGMPEYDTIYGSRKVYTKSAINFAKSRGIVMIGVGICMDVSDLYENHTRVNDVHDIDKAVIDKIAKQILGERFNVDNAEVSGIAQNYNYRQ